MPLQCGAFQGTGRHPAFQFQMVENGAGRFVNGLGAAYSALQRDLPRDLMKVGIFYLQGHRAPGKPLPPERGPHPFGMTQKPGTQKFLIQRILTAVPPVAATHIAACIRLERLILQHDSNRHFPSQKALLTWMIEEPQVFHQISSYIIPEDFTGEIYRKVAELLYQQYEEGEANPARILDHFTEEEEHREAASLFHTRIRELTTPEEREKALKETVVRVKAHSIGEAAARLDPTDIRGLQRLMEAKRQLQDLEKLHISIN